MLKAFFSYSSTDRELVGAVSAEVGRPFVTVDYQAFRAADDLVTTMDQAVEQAGIFALFASRSALKSVWVRHEAYEARFHVASGKLKKVLIVIIDDTVEYSELPGWMQRYLMIRSHSPRPIARKIRALVDEYVHERQHSFFVGRSREIAELQAALTPADAESPPQVVCLTGLTGVGRQTLLGRVAKDTLSFERLVRIDIERGDSANDVAAKLASLVEPTATAADTERLVADVEKLSTEEAVARTIGNIKSCMDLNELPVLHDKGGVLDDEGRFVTPIKQLLSGLIGRVDHLVAVITNRRPARDSLHIGDSGIPVVAVNALSEPDVRQLLAISARATATRITPEQIRSLAPEIRGYPPSVNFAIELVRSYGAAAILARRGDLAETRARPFIRYLRSLPTDAFDRNILRILAANSPLPLETLEMVLETWRCQPVGAPVASRRNLLRTSVGLSQLRVSLGRSLSSSATASSSAWV
jgi:hypothetical protein